MEGAIANGPGVEQPRDDTGYAMVALLVGLSIMAVMLSVALPSWRTIAQREREAELIFRGQQYARAITLFQRKYANAFPPTLDVLLDQRFLRKKYLDPITGEEFQLLSVGQTQTGQAGARGQQAAAGQGTAPQLARGGLVIQPSGLAAQPLGGRAGIMGVASKSEATSLREYNGRTKYNEWVFVAVQATTRAGTTGGGETPTGGAGAAGQGGRGGTQGGQRGTPNQPGRQTQPSGRRF